MYLYVQISFDFPCTGLGFTWVYYSNIATLYVYSRWYSLIPWLSTHSAFYPCKSAIDLSNANPGCSLKIFDGSQRVT